MASCKCPCGEILHNVSVPNESVGYYMSGEDYWRCINLTDGHCTMHELFGAMDSAAIEVWCCKACGRIGFSNCGEMRWYRPDANKP